MTRPFHLDWLLGGRCDTPAPVWRAVEEPVQPSPADWASVAARTPVKIAALYVFTVADEAAEALVLSELAALCAGGRTSWEACVALFAGEREGGDGPSGRSGVPVAGEKPVRLHG